MCNAKRVGVAVESLHWSTTVARAIDWKLSDQAKATRAAQATQEAVNRWKRASTKEEDIWADLIVSLLEKHVKVSQLSTEEEKNLPWPTPGNKACIERNRGEGGCAAQHQQIARDFVPVKAQQMLDSLHARNQANLWTMTQRTVPSIPLHYGGAPQAQRLIDQNPMNMMAMFENIHQTHMAVEEIQSSEELLTISPEHVALLTRNFHRGKLTDVRPLALEEIGGKTRLATLHPALEVWVARRLTQLTLPTLKGLCWTRDSLTGICHGQTELFRRTLPGQPELTTAKLYSADLSAATDHIPFGVARKVMNWLTEKRLVNHHKWQTDIIPLLFGPHRVKDTDIITKRGLFMGLGPSWVVLSLINVAAALYATQQRRSFAVCGDDLIGLWTGEEVARYEAAMEGLGLHLNRKKAFYGVRGVFCEQLATMDDRGRLATIRDVGHLAEPGLSKVRSGRSRYQLAATQALSTERLTGKIANRLKQFTLDKFCFSSAPGPVLLGGSGTGVAHPDMLMRALAKGKVATTFVPDGPEKKILEECTTQLLSSSVLSHERNRGTSYITFEQARNTVMREVRLQRLFTWSDVNEVKPTNFKAFSRQTTKVPFCFHKAQVLNQQADRSRADRNIIQKILRRAERRGGKIVLADLTRMQSVLLRPKRERFLPLATMGSVLEQLDILPGRGVEAMASLRAAATGSEPAVAKNGT